MYANTELWDLNQRDALLKQNEWLKERVKHLEQEIEFLRTHTAIAQGMKGETLIAKLAGGIMSDFAAEHDIVIGDDIKIEVKFSKLNVPVAGSPTKRWNWSKPLGWKDKGKNYNFLLLIGEKDPRYLDQYPKDSPYVFFLIPKARVIEIMTSGSAIGANVALTTNLSTARAATAVAIKQHMVSQELLTQLLADTGNAR